MSEYASNGKANAGLTLGIIGTTLGGLLAANGGYGNGNGGTGLLGGLFGNNGYSRAESEQTTIAALESQIAELKAMRYSDQTGVDLYKNIISQSNAADAKINANMKEVMGYIVQLSQEVALNKQATAYENQLISNKIDCCQEKMNLITTYNQQLNGLADASIISYVNSTFLPGKLVMPASSICPPVVTK